MSLERQPDSGRRNPPPAAALNRRRRCRQGRPPLKFIRVPHESRFALVINDPQPLSGAGSWTQAAQIATVGIFVLVLGAVLYLSRALLLPVAAAAIVALTLSPLVRAGERIGLPAPISAAVIVGAILAAAGSAITLLAEPAGEWIARAPEIGAQLKEKLYVLDQPLAALRALKQTIAPPDLNSVTVNTGMTELLTPLLALLTPAATQILLFLITLIFFLAGQQHMRNSLVALMPSREAKLRMLRIESDVRQNLAGYVGVVAAINTALGAGTAALAWALGYPSPLLLGILAAVLNFIPYLGSGLMLLVLAAIGLISFPTLTQAFLGPLLFVVMTTIEGHIVTPSILGRKLTLSPVMVVLNLAFWTWLWGPVGAFLAVPLSIIALVTLHHLLPDSDPKLPS
ncbi:MAG: AI-2E family transporter [Alphaproteobacteria bacterium]|nr:AI-2E family transporter [Alphaproteobacteria bacterium]